MVICFSSAHYLCNELRLKRGESVKGFRLGRSEHAVVPCLSFSYALLGCLFLPSFVTFSCRFSDVGDAILLSAASRDMALCRMAFQEGRTVVALEPDVSKLKAASDNLDMIIADAAKSGMWARMLTGPIVTVGPGILPVLVPSSNVPVTTSKELDAARSNGHGYASDVDFPHELKVAAAAAELYGLEIRVRSFVDEIWV